MYNIDKDACIACGCCSEVCPCNAIKEEPLAFEIDPDVCVYCGSCQSVCPIDAISESSTKNSSRDEKFKSNIDLNTQDDKFMRGS